VDFTTINTTISTDLATARRWSLCAGEIGYWVAFLGGRVPPSWCGIRIRPAAWHLSRHFEAAEIRGCCVWMSRVVDWLKLAAAVVFACSS
jgi:hypothetical protein